MMDEKTNKSISEASAALIDAINSKFEDLRKEHDTAVARAAILTAIDESVCAAYVALAGDPNVLFQHTAYGFAAISMGAPDWPTMKLSEGATTDLQALIHEQEAEDAIALGTATEPAGVSN